MGSLPRSSDPNKRDKYKKLAVESMGVLLNFSNTLRFTGFHHHKHSPPLEAGEVWQEVARKAMSFFCSATCGRADHCTWDCVMVAGVVRPGLHLHLLKSRALHCALNCWHILMLVHFSKMMSRFKANIKNIDKACGIIQIPGFLVTVNLHCAIN